MFVSLSYQSLSLFPFLALKSTNITLGEIFLKCCLLELIICVKCYDRYKNKCKMYAYSGWSQICKTNKLRTFCIKEKKKTRRNIITEVDLGGLVSTIFLFYQLFSGIKLTIKPSSLFLIAS